jgi:hypothetical protein
MGDSKASRRGGCRCDRVRFEVSASPLLTMACHCTGCQRMTGSAFSLSEAFPSEAFSITKGEPVIGGLHGPTRHFFCPRCMSWMFTRPDGIDWLVNVRATLFDDPSDFVPFIETMASESLAWASTPAIHRFETWPALDDYRGLIEAYAQRRAEPGSR